MSRKILVMGLPGAGKTTLAASLTALMFCHDVVWFNADTIREKYNDWDFSPEGRLRQAHRMREIADDEVAKGKTVICDFIAPTDEVRNIFNADYTVWVDTINAGRYDDTNQMFVPPKTYNIRVTEQNAEKWSRIIFEEVTQ